MSVSAAKGAGGTPGHEDLASDSSPGRWKDSRGLAIALGLALLTGMAFLPVLRHDFVNFDDPDYFSGNAQVLGGLTGTNILWALSTGFSGNWHPLTWLSLMLDAQLFGAGPRGPHLVNLVLHVVNTILLFVVLRRFTKEVWPSAWVAAMFALHPLHVESVAWVAERKDVLSTAFGLAALWGYARYCESASTRAAAPPIIAGRKAERPWVFYVLALGCFVCSLMSKPMLVTLPFLLLLLDYWPLQRITNKTPVKNLVALLGEKLPFFLFSAVSCFITYRVQKRSGAVQSLLNLSLGQRLENAVVSYVRYLEKTLWPTGLATPYPHPGHWPLWIVVLAVIVVTGLSLAAVLYRRELPFGGVGWFWFLGTLVPVIGLVQVGAQSMADRYTYWPLIGVFITLAWSARAAAGHWPWRGKWMALVGGVLVCFAAVATTHQLAFWQNSETLFRHAIATTRNNWLAHYNLGWYLDSQGRLDEALSHYRQAVAIKPNCAEAWNNLGFVLVARKQFPEAINAFEQALQARPDLIDARNNLGKALDEIGRTDEAISEYRRALAQQPEHVGLLNNLALALSRKGLFADAVPLYQKALQLKAEQPVAHYQLANALARVGRFPEAIDQYEAAIRQKPDYAQAQNDLGLALAMSGRSPERAVAHLREAVRLNPHEPNFQCNLGKVLVAQRRFDEALPAFEAALRIAPSNPDAHSALGSAFAMQGKLDEAIRHFQESLRYRPDNPNTHFNLGKALATEHKLAEAKEQFREVLRLNPNFGPARQELQALEAQP